MGLAILLLSGCSSPQDSTPAEEVIEAVEDFQASAEVAGALSTMQLSCTELTIASEAWLSSSLPPDFEKMEPAYLSLVEALDYYRDAIGEYELGSITLEGDESREEPLFDSYSQTLDRFGWQVEDVPSTTQTLDVGEGFRFSANFLDDSGLKSFEAVCNEVDSTGY